MKRDLLIELGTEEMPARFIRDGQQQLGEKVAQWLTDHQISFDTYQTYSTPRRLAVWVRNVSEKQADQIQEARGPALHIARTEEGEWSKAAIGFARKQKIDVDQLQIKTHKGQQYVFAVKQEQGAKTAELMQASLPKVFQQLSFPISMRWSGHVRFIRPVRWLVCLFGDEVIPIEWAGVKAGRTSRGHRFLGFDRPITAPADYCDLLKKEYVWVDVDERQATIQKQLRELEEKHHWKIPIDEDLLDEVTHLVEYPTVLVGQFAQEFLSLPKQVLITTMQKHQRYFPVEDEQQRLLPYFIAVRNGDQQHLDLVKRGNEKVLQARLADARFFYEEDLKIDIDDAVKALDRIVFQQDLGTVGDRVQRIRRLAKQIAAEQKLDSETTELIDRAAQICKFDLVTQMVDEFSSLEGYMGYIYAKEAGEDERVAKAIADHHRPRYAGDDLPSDIISTVLSLADKIDTIAACMGIGIVPSGSQDPYSLRRKALAVLQILLAHPQIALDQLFTFALNQLAEAKLLKRPKEEVRQDLQDFFARRFQSILNEEQIRYDVIEAVLADQIRYPQLTLAKAKVLMEHLEQEGFKKQVEGFTRVANLVHANPVSNSFDPQLIEKPEERSLYDAYQQAKTSFEQADQERKPDKMYQALMTMVPAIHDFFDHVMVMVEDVKIRQNRLALLQRINHLTAQFADFRKIVFPS